MTRPARRWAPGVAGLSPARAGAAARPPVRGRPPGARGPIHRPDLTPSERAGELSPVPGPRVDSVSPSDAHLDPSPRRLRDPAGARGDIHATLGLRPRGRFYAPHRSA